MTDQLETDLRTVLAQRANEVTVDAPAGEAAIAGRLEIGDAGLAEIVRQHRHGREPWHLVAAAVIVVSLIGTVVWASTRDDARVVTNPGPVMPAVLEFAVAVSGVACDLPAPDGGQVIDDPSPADGRRCAVLDAPQDGNALLERADALVDQDGRSWFVQLHLTPAGLGELNRLLECPANASCAVSKLAVIVDGDLRALIDLGPERRVGADDVRIRGPLTEAGAVALAAALQAGAEGDPTDTVPRATLEFSPALMAGPCSDSEGAVPSVDDGAQVCYRLGSPLPGNALLEAATPRGTTTATYSVTLRFTATGLRDVNAVANECFEQTAICPTGRLAIVVDGAILSAPTITTPELTREIEISGDFTRSEALALAASLQPRPDSASETTTTAVPAHDPTLGDADESAKDIAERVALQLFGEEYVTVSVSEEGLIELVTMEGPGGAIVAEVAHEGDDGAPRVLHVRPATGPDHPLEIESSGSLAFDVPEPGDLTYTLLDEQLSDLRSATMPGVEGGKVGFLGPVDGEPRWVSIRLETPDGRFLVWLESLGD